MITGEYIDSSLSLRYFLLCHSDTVHPVIPHYPLCHSVPVSSTGWHYLTRNLDFRILDSNVWIPASAGMTIKKSDAVSSILSFRPILSVIPCLTRNPDFSTLNSGLWIPVFTGMTFLLLSFSTSLLLFFCFSVIPPYPLCHSVLDTESGFCLDIFAQIVILVPKESMKGGN